MDEEQAIGVGPTHELSLRVSVASLVRVVFSNPDDGHTLLGLERKATLLPAEGRVTVKAQPFGGALRINDLLPLSKRIGDFHFDSQRSRSEMDFRIFIRPAAWGAVREFCLEQFDGPDGTVLESGPDRELAEEFGDALGTGLSQNQYQCSPLWTVLENNPAPTENIHAERQPTVRVYRVFEVRITDLALAKAITSNSQRYPNHNLAEFAREDARSGGKGRANAMLALPMESIISFYLAVPEEQRNSPAAFEGHLLEPSVTTILDGVLASKYQRV